MQNKTPRLRLLTVCQGMALLWPIYWYVRDGDNILFWAVLAIVVGATLFPKLQSRTVRQWVWGGLLLGILLLACNTARINPPETGLDLLRIHRYDRFATAALVLGVGAVWLPMSRMIPVLIVAGCLPMMMLVLVRAKTLLPTPNGAILFTAIGWGLLALLIQIQNGWGTGGQKRQHHQTGALRPRTIGALLLFALAALLTLLSRVGIEAGVAQLHKLEMLHFNRRWPQHSGASQLSLRAPPGGWDGQLRPLMLIDAPQAPEYLREAAFPDFVAGNWVRGRKQPRILDPSSLGNDTKTGENQYTLVDPPQISQENNPPWHIDYLRSMRSPDLLLPAGTHSFWAPVDAEIQLDPAGIASFETVPRQRIIRAQVDTKALSRNPNGTKSLLPPWDNEANVLAIPDEWENTVAQWVSHCSGLDKTATTLQAVNMLTSHFQMHFTYDLEGPENPSPDLLHAFMREKRGHCTLFASAATLMLRSIGIPARVVGGYYTTEWQHVANRWVVRERHGHAWCEAWDAQRNAWILVEATPPGSMPDDFQSPPSLRLWREATGLWFRNAIQTLRNGKWLGQLLGFIAYGVLWLGGMRWWIAGGITLLLAASSIWKYRQRQLLPPEVLWRNRLLRRMHQLERKITGAGQRRHASESWNAWQKRITPKLPPEQATQLQQTVETYQRLRYAPQFNITAAHQWLKNQRR